MLTFIDHIIEKILKKKLHNNRKQIIKKTLQSYRNKHPHAGSLKDLQNKIEMEADRIYPMIDKSILRALIKRAKYTFWLTIIASTFIVGITGGFTSGAALPFIIPILTAFVAWTISLVIIPISYNQRAEGAMDSVIEQFEKSQHKSSLVVNNKNISQAEIDSINAVLNKMNIKINRLSATVASLTPVLTNHAINSKETLVEASASEQQSMRTKKFSLWENSPATSYDSQEECSSPANHCP